MNKLDEIVNAIDNYMWHIDYDCSNCPFALITDDGLIKCKSFEPIGNEDDECVDWECKLDKEKIKEKIIEAVKESENQ